MILLTRLNGSHFALNADLIQKVESKPDTLVTLIDNSVYVVSDSLDEVIDMVVDFRSKIVARSIRSEIVVDPTPLRVVGPGQQDPTGSGDDTTDEEAN